MAAGQTEQTSSTTFASRLRTFQDYWDDEEAAAVARQLAAIGHIYDRPPLEALIEGSRCVSCSAFMPRNRSIRLLGGSFGLSPDDEATSEPCHFHDRRCIRLQIRMPVYAHDSSVDNRTNPRPTIATSSTHTPPAPRAQPSSLLTLPTELRLEIYAQLIQPMPSVINFLMSPRGGKSTVWWNGQFNRQKLLPTSLLCTCRTIHAEVLDLLFRNVTFKFQETREVYLFLRQIGVHGRRVLRAVDTFVGNREDAVAFALLGSCPRLVRMTLRISGAKPSAKELALVPGPRPPLWREDAFNCLLEIGGLEEVRILRFLTLSVGFDWTDEDGPNAEIVRRELTRAKGTPRMDA